MDFPVLLKQTVQSSDKFKCTHRILLWLLHPVKAAEQDRDTDQKTKFFPAAAQATFSLRKQIRTPWLFMPLSLPRSVLWLLQLGNTQGSAGKQIHNVLLGKPISKLAQTSCITGCPTLI